MSKETNHKHLPFLKDIRLQTKQVGDRLTKVIVLKETPYGITFIPLNGIARVDYDRMKALYEETYQKQDLLSAMRDTRANNGRNMLVVYQDIIKNKVYQPKQEGTEYTVKDNKVYETEYDKEDTDAKGEVWNPEIHTAGKVKNNDGTWRKKAGPKKPTNVEFDDDDH